MTDRSEWHVREENDKRNARESFLGFYMRMTGFLPPLHVQVMCQYLQAMEEDKIDRLMIFAPPRHAKSTIASILFPAWLLGKDPTTKILSSVHTERYAAKIGKNVRNLLKHPKWPFPSVELASDSQAKVQWATTSGGEYNGFGIVGGNQHGNPAEWLLCDDIVKGRKVALSPHMREEVWETYKTDLLSRLQGRAKQLQVITRWHQDDPPGRILPEGYNGRPGWMRDRETGELWFVCSLPAIAEHDNDLLGREAGEWLWPERFGDSSVLPAFRKRGGWVWSGLFQQRPSPEEGLMFSREHLANRYSPRRLSLGSLRIYGASDYAVTEEGALSNDNPDWTVHTVWGVDPDWNVYLLDMWRGRTTPDRWIDEWVRLVRKWRPLTWFEESGQIIRSVNPMIVKAMREHGAFIQRQQLTSTTDKASRAQALLGIAATGKLYLPLKDELTDDVKGYVEAFERELLEFPGGTKDDTVDSASLFARGALHAGTPEGPRASPHGDTLDDLWRRHEEQERRRK